MDDQARPASDSSPGEPAAPKTAAMDEKRRAALLAALAIGPIMLTLRGTPAQATHLWGQEDTKQASCTQGAMSAGRGDKKITYEEYMTCKKD
jgi:hypothetical protein